MCKEGSFKFKWKEALLDEHHYNKVHIMIVLHDVKTLLACTDTFPSSEH